MLKMCRFFADKKGMGGLFFAILILSGCSGPAPRSPNVAMHQLPDTHRQEVVMTALGLMGSPYRYGGRDPVEGFDCSGLVNYVFQLAARTPLPRSADEQAAVSRKINRRELREGDLVFFNTLGRPNSHVGIYIGDGRFVNAPSSGGRVRVDSLSNPYFSKRFNSARTLFASR